MQYDFIHFNYANSHIQNALLSRLCTAFYGSHILPMFENCIEDMYTAWRIAMCSLWGPHIVY